jgi:hypothetical protein
MLDTVPRRVTARIVEFCSTLSPETPRFIKSHPSADAVQGHCFDNVGRKIERAGGSVQYGWAIWHLPGLYLEAEHHGVWRKRSGELVDVSPQINGTRRILFLPDVAAIYDPMNIRSNVIVADRSDDLDASALVSAMLCRNEILDGYRAGGALAAFIRDEDQREMDRLVAIAGDILRKRGHS